ncbi:MAG: winged helix-turn-helix domain-containing protein [Candidatus Hodarchaeales archaeon]|jgi:DNA-binding transcriptional ArsR family regulator
MNYKNIATNQKLEIKDENKEESIDINTRLEQLKVLNDPIRSSIYFHIVSKGENGSDAKSLQSVVKISRSTLSHHLTKLVEMKLLEVEIPQTGRAIKTYKSPKPKPTKVILDCDELVKKQDSNKIVEFLLTQYLEFRFFSNRAENSLNNIQNFPINNIELDEDDRINFNVKNRKFFLPMLFQGVINEKHAKILQDGIKKLFFDAQEKFNCKDSGKQYIVNIGMFPVLED